MLQSDKCLRYLKNRKISLATASKLEIGYFGESNYSEYHDRMLFPLYDVYGHWRTYQGRAMFPGPYTTEKPKYWHLGKAVGFTKADHLYGLFQFADEIVAQGHATLVEGPPDVASLWEAGLPSVSTLGLNLSHRHCMLLRQLTDRLLVWYNSDEAGTKSIDKTLKIAGEWGLRCEVIRTTLDVNETLVAKGKQEVWDHVQKMLRK